MRDILVIGLVLALLVLTAPAFATENPLSSRSAGKIMQDHSADLGTLMLQRPPVVRLMSPRSENFSANDQQSAGIANRHDQLFEVYSADVDLISDLDDDSYHHALNVSFDVDVSNDSASVYAKLYLRRDGGPWNQYFTTDLFSIHGDSIFDIYEVETELLEGYVPGYYSVLIEIYSLDHAFMVAELQLDSYYLDKDITLESLDWDAGSDVVHDQVSVSVGAGSFASLLLFVLVLPLVIVVRNRITQRRLRKLYRRLN